MASVLAAAAPHIISAAGSIGGGYLASRGQKETKQQRRSRKTADELLASLKGEGPFSDLFRMDEAGFNKAYVEPSLSRFKNQIAPQIQQQYIYGGQQRGTGLEDQLLRAGVDLNQMINEQYMNYQQGAQNRGANAINSIIGMGAGAPEQATSGQQLSQSVSGYLSSPAFADLVKSGQGYLSGQPQQQSYGAPQGLSNQAPKGFIPDWGIGDSRWNWNRGY